MKELDKQILLDKMDLILEMLGNLVLALSQAYPHITKSVTKENSPVTYTYVAKQKVGNATRTITYTFELGENYILKLVSTDIKDI